MKILNRLQKWYKMHCDGDWEHTYGLSIETIDNPGWSITIDLADTLLENADFDTIKNTDSAIGELWINCYKKEDKFIGFGGPTSLERILTIFLDWAESAIDTSSYDKVVSDLSAELKKYASGSYNLDRLREIRYEIDNIPNEHIKKSELIDQFSLLWKSINS